MTECFRHCGISGSAIDERWKPGKMLPGEVAQRHEDDSGIYAVVSSSGNLDVAEYKKLINRLGFGHYHAKKVKTDALGVIAR